MSDPTDNAEKGALNSLERQVDAMLDGFAAELDRVPGPNAAVLERVRASVRHRINEQWLDEQPSPAPSPALLRSVCRAVRQELTPLPHPAARGLGRWTPQTRAGFAAAAVMAVCVGLIYEVGNRTRSAVQPDAYVQAAQQRVDLFVETAQVVLATDEFSESVLSELDAIEARLAGSSPSDSAAGVLEELDGAMQDILEAPDAGDRTMGIRTWSLKTVG